MVYRRTQQVVKRLAARRSAILTAARETASEGGMAAVQIAPVAVRLQDERLTTVSAEAMLRGRGKKGAERRAVVDQAAAVLILQHALDSERATGRPPGELVQDENVTGEA